MMPEFQSPLVPVVVIDDATAAGPLADALVEGGLPIVEVTLRTAAGLEAIRRLSGREDIQVGAGTVLSVAELDQAVAAGAQFIVSPGTSPALLDRAAELGVWAIPGAVTASEVLQVLERGLNQIKFFPAAAAGGPPVIKALSGPFSAARFIPTGGIGPANLAEYLNLPSVAAVGGSWMVPRQAIAARDFGAIRGLVGEAAALAAQIRQGKEQ
ncbi:MAG: bifunctional 4-hydroxy-2-oxoglutarate aldolase/2-dehydro-3-deoxy-phosphogluconate aldolase [Bifidobacteriaceae bacterium]|jgi:2-dehydro-3-deoxyphosphogluconate aldolase/(4S)-4-hydroxy-2-oxoglutarate aldolase|nr:bifunctional 4-hydroxy-2-oxoglutarate aldolase/2-dehydro-3-deoxy-phosphogluconate aldolase [Bifidobacteriaceae bacterium]